MKSKYGNHMATNPLGRDEFSPVMVESFFDNCSGSGPNGLTTDGTVRGALADFILVVLAQRLADEYAPLPDSNSEFSEGLLWLTEDMASKAMEAMDKTLATFVDGNGRDFFHAHMKKRGRAVLKEEADLEAMRKAAVEKRANAAAQRQA